MKVTVPVFVTDLLPYDSFVTEAMMHPKAQSKHEEKYIS